MYIDQRTWEEILKRVSKRVDDIVKKMTIGNKQNQHNDLCETWESRGRLMELRWILSLPNNDDLVEEPKEPQG